MDKNIQQVDFLKRYADDFRKERMKSISFFLGDEKMTATVSPTIGLKEFAATVNSIIDTCFDDDIYIPWVKECAERVYIISAYTDIALPQDGEQWFYIVSNTDIYNKVIELVDSDQIASLKSSVDDGIKCRLSDRWAVMRQEVAQALNTVTGLSEQYTQALKEINDFTSTELKDFIKQVVQSPEKTEAGIHAANVKMINAAKRKRRRK